MIRTPSHLNGDSATVDTVGSGVKEHYIKVCHFAFLRPAQGADMADETSLTTGQGADVVEGTEVDEQLPEGKS